MTKLNWEKRNRIELPKQKRRESQRTKILKAYANGSKNERERIIKLIENNTDFDAISNRMVFTSGNWVDPCRLIELIER
jgi:hypothetical protein